MSCKEMILWTVDRKAYHGYIMLNALWIERHIMGTGYMLNAYTSLFQYSVPLTMTGVFGGGHEQPEPE